MAILRRLEVDRSSEIQLFNDHTRPHVKVVPDNFDQLIGGTIGGPVRVDEHR